jgi:hypothetical protein
MSRRICGACGGLAYCCEKAEVDGKLRNIWGCSEPECKRDFIIENGRQVELLKVNIFQAGKKPVKEWTRLQYTRQINGVITR